jgi:hypothetical protein
MRDKILFANYRGPNELEPKFNLSTNFETSHYYCADNTSSCVTATYDESTHTCVGKDNKPVVCHKKGDEELIHKMLQLPDETKEIAKKHNFLHQVLSLVKSVFAPKDTLAESVFAPKIALMKDDEDDARVDPTGGGGGVTVTPSIAADAAADATAEKRIEYRGALEEMKQQIMEERKTPDNFLVTVEKLKAISKPLSAYPVDKKLVEDAISEFVKLTQPAMNVPGVLFVNDLDFGKDDKFYNIDVEDKENVLFEPTKKTGQTESARNLTIKIPKKSVIFSGAGNYLVESLTGTQWDGNIKGPNGLLFGSYDKVLGPPGGDKTKVRFMLGASGSGKSFTTMKNLKMLHKRATDAGSKFKCTLRFSYGTCTITPDKKIQIFSDTTTWDPAPDGSNRFFGPDVTTQFKNAVRIGQFDNTETSAGAVDLLEAVCQSNSIPVNQERRTEKRLFKHQVIRQTKNNPKSSRGTIAWVVTIGEGDDADTYVIVDAPGNEKAYDIICGSYDFSYLLNKLKNKFKEENESTDEAAILQAEDKIVEAFLKPPTKNGGLLSIIDVHKLNELDGFTQLGVGPVKITKADEERKRMRTAARAEQKKQEQAGITIDDKIKSAYFPDDDERLIYAYMRKLAEESLYIRFMVGALATVLNRPPKAGDEAKPKTPDMYYTFPFLTDSVQGTVVRSCLKSDSNCSDQGAGMYYPTTELAQQYEDTFSDIQKLHAKHIELKNQFLKNTKAIKMFPIQFLMGEYDETFIPISNAKDVDVQAVIVIPTHGDTGKRTAVFESTKYLTRQLVGDYITASSVPLFP